MIFDAFLTHVLPSVAGCPDALALDHILKAARTFCARTLVWNYSTPPFVAEVGKANYTLQIPKDQELVRLLLADVGGDEYATPDGTSGRRAARQLSGNYVVMQGLRDFILSPAPSVAGIEVITDVAVKPTMQATDWPDDLGEYVTDIAAGAIATLCLLPRVEWSSKDLAGAQMALFNSRISTVGLKVSHGLSAGRKSARIAWF